MAKIYPLYLTWAPYALVKLPPDEQTSKGNFNSEVLLVPWEWLQVVNPAWN